MLDDSRLNRRLIKDVLVEAGFDADAVGDFESFEKALTWWKPNSVVVDVNLPRESGLDVVRRVHDVFPDIPVVLMSAMALNSLEKLSAECGADGSFSTLDGYAGIVELLYALYERLGL